MSIEKRVMPFSRSFRSLIKKTRRTAEHIKDLKDLNALQIAECYRHSGLTDLKKTKTIIFIVARGPVPRDLPVDRSTARDRPSPYGEGRRH